MIKHLMTKGKAPNVPGRKRKAKNHPRKKTFYPDLCFFIKNAYLCLITDQSAKNTNEYKNRLHMKFTVSSAELLKGITLAQKAIPSKASEPILENYLFDLKGETLSITASDGEITIRTKISVVSTEEEGRMAVASRQITDLLKELPDQPVTINTDGENTFKFSWLTGESTLPYFTADDYPKAATTKPEAKTVKFPCEILAEGIGSTVYASSDESNRPIMNSIFFDIKTDYTTLVASDLQKLICYTAPEVTSAEPCSFILNKRHALVLRSILGKDVDEVDITFDDKVAVFVFGQTKMTCALVAGKYPDYTTIIPKNNSNILRVERTVLLNAAKRISVCSPKGSNQVRFDFTQGGLEISAEDLGFEIAAHEKVECQYNGDDIVIGFKSNHIIEILSNLSCNGIVMKLADKRRSVLILPEEEEAENERVFGIVMPNMVR